MQKTREPRPTIRITRILRRRRAGTRITRRRQGVTEIAAGQIEPEEDFRQEGPSIPEPVVESSVCKPSGRLRAFRSNWTLVTCDRLILQWTKGYRIPFISHPSQLSAPVEPRWSANENLLISYQINSLLEKRAIRTCSAVHGEFLYRIFLISKSDGSQSLILNVKKLKEFVRTEHFELKDWKIAKRLISPNRFMATIDLKDAYHLVLVAQPHGKFLRFQFNGIRYEYPCLPFGLSSALKFSERLWNRS